jgi:uncharacterized protein
MKYRKFGKLDWNVSVLGFGAMRLPQLDADMTHVNVPLSIEMIRHAIDHGVNYVDSAYMYHGGRSEEVVGQALQNGYRQKVRLATKLPARQIKAAGDFDRIFDHQRQKLQTDKVDFYLLHGLMKDTWTRVRDLGVLKWAEQRMAKGEIGNLGFSFHDSLDVFKSIIDGYDNWTFCQIQYNYMDTEFQAGTKGLEYANGKGLAVVIMEPLRGGKLAKEPPPTVSKIFNAGPVKRSPQEWGLLWVWEHPQVTLALSGMSAMQHVVDNLAIADKAGPGTLNKAEMALFDEARKSYRSLSPTSCTGCQYCMPCPSGVDIPHTFSLYNDAVIYNDAERSSRMYNSPMFSKEAHADNCIECGTCVEACPQKIQIPEELKKAHALLSGGKK